MYTLHLNVHITPKCTHYTYTLYLHLHITPTSAHINKGVGNQVAEVASNFTSCCTAKYYVHVFIYIYI